MKVEELMVGDWIFCTYKQKNYKVAEIKTVADEELRLVVYDNNIPLVFRIKYFKPIPLTKDILEKNGIKYQWGMPWYQGGFDGVFELHYNNSQDIAFGDTPTEIQIPISYVHQLQHALKLCGITKNIEL